MLFNSITFAVVLLIVFTIWWLPAMQTVKRRNLLIIITGSVFYGWWDIRFLALLFFTATVDYFVARALEKSVDEKKRRRLLYLSLASNLSVLGFFKYFNFFAESFAGAAEAFGFHPDFVTLKIVLPVGISFYTFQALSYTIDVYRQRIPAVQKADVYFAFITFFPQLVAGPIARAPQLVPQLERISPFNTGMATTGLRLMLWGFFKKCVIADNLSPIADAVFARDANPNAIAVVIGTIAFTLQVYCDFSGYSLIAKGTARLFGIELVDNFRFPYFATTLRDFWRRWHISLSTWFNDYVFSTITIKLRNSGNFAIVAGLICTFALSGLWHGAGWTFVLWGVFHGICLSLEFTYNQFRLPKFPSPIRSVLLLTAVAFSFLLFRSPDIAGAGNRLATLFTGNWSLHSSIAFPRQYDSLFFCAALTFLCLFTFIVEGMQYTKRDMLFYRSPRAVRIALYYSLVLVFLLIGVYQAPPTFIYFQF